MKKPMTIGVIMTMLGIGIFSFTPVYAQDVYVNIEDLPEWADYASNVMYLSTEAWKNANEDLEFYTVENPLDSDFKVQWVKEFGGEHVGYAYGSQFIEVGLGDSKCGGQWNPYSEGYISHIMKHEIGHIFGHEHDNDPDSIMYPVALNLEYGTVEEEYRLTEGYGQFVQFCTIKDLTSYYFSITTTDETYGFDYYVVPSSNEFTKWSEGKTFQHYSNEDCFGENWLSIDGTCKGISTGSGIIIIMDKELTSPLEIITVKQAETPNVAYSKSGITTKLITNEEAYEPPSFEYGPSDPIFENPILSLQDQVVSLESKVKRLEQENNQLKSDLLTEKFLPSDSQDTQKDFKIASFVDPNKDPQLYIDRYINEPEYKKWFDDNYSDYPSIYEAVGKRPPIPDWIKNNAKWWSEGKISEEEFVSAIEYLVKEGIIRV